jgi:hypothetical protein
MDQKPSGVLKPIKDLPIRQFILLVKFLKKYNQLIPHPSEVDILNNLIYTINGDGSLPPLDQRPFLVRRHLFLQLCFSVGITPHICPTKVFEFYTMNYKNI